MNKVALVRGAFLAQYETQIYFPLIGKYDITAFSSLHPQQNTYPFKLKKLPSPMDINFGPFSTLKMPVLNRVFIDAHFLLGLENQLNGFDIAHCADTFYNFSRQCVNAKQRGYVKKVVATIFENIPFNNETIMGRKYLKNYVINGVDHFIAIAERSKEALVLEGCPENKITVVTQHIDTTRFLPTRKKYTNNINILFVGRVEYYKGIYEVIYAAKKLLSDPELSSFKLNFKIVGSGTELNNIKNLITRLGINNSIHFLKLPYSQMHTVHKGADIFVAPSRATKTYQEQFCTSLLEAQSAGMPIVTTYSGGIPENVGKCALMANPGDFYSLSNQIKRFILNPKLRKQYGEMARAQAVNKFDIKIGAQKIAEIYDKVLSVK